MSVFCWFCSLFVLIKCDTVLNGIYREPFIFSKHLSPYIIPESGVEFYRKVTINPGVNITFNGHIELSLYGLDACAYKYVSSDIKGLINQDNAIYITGSVNYGRLIHGGNINMCNIVFDNTGCLFTEYEYDNIRIKHSIFRNTSCVAGHISRSIINNDKGTLYGGVVKNNNITCQTYGTQISVRMEMLSNIINGCNVQLDPPPRYIIHVSNNIFKNCPINTCAAIHYVRRWGGTVKIYFNYIINYYTGLAIGGCYECTENDYQFIHGNVVIHYNNFINNWINIGYIWNGNNQNVDASHNYYNTINDTLIRSKICDGCDYTTAKSFITWWPYSANAFDINKNDTDKPYIYPQKSYSDYTCTNSYSDAYCLSSNENMTLNPIIWPTHQPTISPTISPTTEPTLQPTTPNPTIVPSKQPTNLESETPTTTPTSIPSNNPTNTATNIGVQIAFHVDGSSLSVSNNVVGVSLGGFVGLLDGIEVGVLVGVLVSKFVGCFDGTIVGLEVVG